MNKRFFVLIWVLSLILVGLGVFTITRAQETDAVLITRGNVRIRNGSLIVGNLDNFTEIDFNGRIFLNGLACVQKEILIPAITVGTGINPPSEKTFDIGESGNVKESVLEFDQGDNEPVYMVFSAPTDLENSEDITFAILWMPEQSYSSGTYTWQLEYFVKNNTGIGANYTEGTPTTITVDVTPIADFYFETEFTDTIDLNRGQSLIATFSRTDNDANSGGLVRFFKIEYKSDRLGLGT